MTPQAIFWACIVGFGYLLSGYYVLLTKNSIQCSEELLLDSEGEHVIYCHNSDPDSIETLFKRQAFHGIAEVEVFKAMDTLGLQGTKKKTLQGTFIRIDRPIEHSAYMPLPFGKTLAEIREMRGDK